MTGKKIVEKLFKKFTGRARLPRSGWRAYREGFERRMWIASPMKGDSGFWLRLERTGGKHWVCMKVFNSEEYALSPSREDGCAFGCLELVFSIGVYLDQRTEVIWYKGTQRDIRLGKAIVVEPILAIEVCLSELLKKSGYL